MHTYIYSYIHTVLWCVKQYAYQVIYALYIVCALSEFSQRLLVRVLYPGITRATRFRIRVSLSLNPTKRVRKPCIRIRVSKSFIIGWCMIPRLDLNILRVCLCPLYGLFPFQTNV